MSKTEWPEIQAIQLKSSHELTLSGDNIAKKIAENDGMIDESLYEIGKQLNYLKLAKLGLLTISPKLSHLSQLTQLSIIENKIKEIPLEISLLTNLIYLDLSYNNINTVPNIFNQLSKLRILNLRSNEITEIFSFNGLISLQELCLDHNLISSLPDDIFSLMQLMVLDLSYNDIVDISSKILCLKNLKILNLESNHINSVLPELGQMIRLKQLQLQNNPLKNEKTQLKKLINDNLYKAIFEYLKKLESNNSKKYSKISNDCKATESLTTEANKMLEIIHDSSTKIVTLKNRTNLARPQVVYFILHNLQFTPEKFKKFIKFQEQLHKNECDSRKTTTIGTHDLSMIKFPLMYSPKEADDFTIQMMNFSKLETGKTLYTRLLKEAEVERKNKKRGNLSGVYQYLYMINIDQLQGVVEDTTGTVVSYPPLTNSNTTKMCLETTELLIEVIGTKLEKCKYISEMIVQWMMVNDVLSDDSKLKIEPVRVYEDNSDLLDGIGEKLLVIFPDRTDLNNLGFTVMRN